MVGGPVSRLYRWPVKSFAGERMGALELAPEGVLGDRAYAVTDAESGLSVSARQAPCLLERAAAYGEGAPGSRPPVVTTPDGSVHQWDDGRLPRMLEDAVGRRVTRPPSRARTTTGRARCSSPSRPPAGRWRARSG